MLTALYWLVGQQAAVAINLLFALCLLLLLGPLLVWGGVAVAVQPGAG